MRLAKSSPPANSVPTNDNLSMAIVASGDIEEKNSKESNNDSISVINTDVPNKDLFTIDNCGNTTRVFPSQSLPQCQENFLKWIEEGHEVHGLLLPLVNTRYDAVKATIEKFKRPVPTTPRNPYGDNTDSEGSHQSMPPKNNTPSQELQINLDMERFIEALPHLEPIHIILQGRKIPSVVYVHAHLVLLHGGQCSKLILRKKIFVETHHTLPILSYNILNQSLMNIRNQLPFTFDTCFANGLSPFCILRNFLLRHCHNDTLRIMLLIHQEPFQKIICITLHHKEHCNNKTLPIRQLIYQVK